MSLLNAPLEAFLAVAKTQTVQAAAKELGITQSGVTQRVRGLETSLSATLFTRSRKGMALTQEGEALLRYCQAVRDLEGEALAQIQKAGVLTSVRLCVAGPTSIMNSRVIPKALPVLKNFPNLLLTFQISDIERRDEDLRSGVCQLAVLSHEQVAKEMDSKVLKPEKYVLVGTSRWKGRQTEKIIKEERIIDFDPTDQTSFRYLKKFKMDVLASKDRLFVNGNESLIHMFKEGIGYGVLTLEVAKPWVESGDLILLNGGAYLENPLALAWYPRSQMPAYFKALVGAIN